MHVSQEQFDRFLIDISVCFIERDFSKWESRILLPFALVTQRSPIILETRSALLENFHHYLSACDIMRVDKVFRDPLQLEDCKDGTWLGTYETRLISLGGLATAPYVSTALMQLDAGRLKMTSLMGARGHYDWTSQEP